MRASSRLEPVPVAPDGADVLRVARVVLDLLAEPPHVDGHCRSVAVLESPHLCEQLLAAERSSRMSHQMDEQLVLARR